MDSADLMRLAKLAIEEKKGEDVVVFQVASRVGYTDYIIVATGQNRRHVEAIVEEVRGKLVQNKQEIVGVEGREQGEWVLLDAGDLVVHVMQPATRDYYHLDQAWADCKIEVA
ncbi:ribosome silencing factor [Myxococcota bacterium]|nr:ribosome silencing factor [Myxococcota bacterium]